MGAGGDRGCRAQPLDVPRASSPQLYSHLPSTVWGLAPREDHPHWPGWTQPACLGGRAQLCGFTPAMLAGLRAERSCGLFFGSPVRRCVGQG